MRCLGSTHIKFTHPSGPSTIIFALVSDQAPYPFILGRPDQIKLGLLPKDYPHHCHFNRIQGAEHAKQKHDTVTTKSTSEMSKLTSEIHLLCDKYKDVFDTTKGLRPMRGPPMKIYLRDDTKITPFRALKARPTALHQEKEAQAEVQRLLEAGIIKHCAKATAWLQHGFFRPKPDKTLRLVFDCSPLNKYLQRPVHQFYNTDDIIRRIPSDTTILITLDCKKGYWQLELDESAQELLTMLLPQGTFSWTRAPMGCSASSDEWCRRSDQAFEGIPNLTKIVDDIIIHGKSEKEALETLEKILQRCREHHITLGRNKIQAGHEVTFVGHIIKVTENGVQIEPHPDKLKALREYPQPGTISDLRSFMGLAVQFSRFNPDLAHLATPLRTLTEIKTKFIWLPEHQKAFEDIKAALTSDALVKPFIQGANTMLLTDASRIAFGFALVQTTSEDPNRLRLIECGSISTSKAQANYSVTEIELAALLWAIQKCSYYLQACPQFTCLVDHRPLEKICNEKKLQDLPNARIQRMVEKMSDYNMTVKWCSGVKHRIADAISRSPCFPPDDQLKDVEIAHKTWIRTIRSKDALGQLEDKADADEVYQQVIRAWKENKRPKQLPHSHPAQLYKSIWDDISMEGRLLTKHHKIIIPQSARKHILDLLHEPHAGITKTKECARQKYYWPRMNDQIEQKIKSCKDCQEWAPQQQKEPLMQIRATRVFEHCSMDPFENNRKDYCAFCDRLSGMLFVFPITGKTAQIIINFILKCCNTAGYPAHLRTDSGPPFTSKEFRKFCEDSNISHNTPAAEAPWSAGHAERAVQTAQDLLNKNGGIYNNKFISSLLQHNCTPRADGYSPADIFNNRVTRSKLPQLEKTFVNIDQEKAVQARHLVLDKDKESHDKRAKELPPLHLNQQVLIWDKITESWNRQGTVKEIIENSPQRSYKVLCNGNFFTRNRRHLRPLHNQQIPEAESNPETLDNVTTNAPEAARNIPGAPENPDLQPRRSARLAQKNSLP